MERINATAPTTAQAEQFRQWGGVDPDEVVAQLNNDGDSWQAKREDVERVLNQLFEVPAPEPPEPVEAPDKDRVQCDIAFNKHCDQWFANGWANIPHIQHGIDKLMASLKGKPVILCGAGESLFDALDLLWEIKDRAIIMSVDHSWRFLPADIVMNVDSQDVTYQRYFTSAWRRVPGRIMVAQTYANPRIVRGWARAGGELRWFHAEYGASLPARWEADQKAYREAVPDIPLLGVHYTAFNTALGMLLAAEASKVITVGCDYCWAGRYYWDIDVIDPASPGFTQMTYDEKPMLLVGRNDKFDGQIYTTEKLQHMAETMLNTFSNKINAVSRPRDDGATDIKFEKRRGLHMKFAGRPDGVLQPMQPFSELYRDYLIDRDEKREWSESARETD